MPHYSQTNLSPPSRSFQTGKILVLSICHFIHDIYSSFLAPLLPLFIEKLSISMSQAGLLASVVQIPSLLNPYIGTLADRISVRYFIILTPALTAIPMSLIGLASNYAILLILLFITGISVAVFHVPAPVLISRLSGIKKGLGMSFYMIGGELARTLGPLIAVGGVFLMGLEGFYPIMVFGLISSCWLFFTFREIPVNSDKSHHISVIETWHEIRFILLPLTAILIAREFMHTSLTFFLPTFIKIETGNLWLAGASLTIFEGAGVIGILFAGLLSDGLGRRQILLYALLSAPLILLLFICSSGGLRYLSLILLGLTILSTTPVMLALIQEYAKKSPSAGNGFFMMIFFMTRSVIVPIVGLIADIVGLHTTYLISAIIGLLGIPFILLLPKGK